MTSSPFRDEMQALRSALSELQEENSRLRTAMSHQEAELEALRAQLPENIGPVMRRLQDENAELRGRVAEIEPQLAQYADIRRRLNRNTPLTGFGEAVTRLLEEFLGRR